MNIRRFSWKNFPVVRSGLRKLLLVSLVFASNGASLWTSVGVAGVAILHTSFRLVPTGWPCPFLFTSPIISYLFITNKPKQQSTHAQIPERIRQEYFALGMFGRTAPERFRNHFGPGSTCVNCCL